MMRVIPGLLLSGVFKDQPKSAKRRRFPGALVNRYGQVPGANFNEPLQHIDQTIVLVVLFYRSGNARICLTSRTLRDKCAPSRNGVDLRFSAHDRPATGVNTD